MKKIILSTVFALLLAPNAQADERGFPAWIAQYKQRAVTQGLNPSFLDQSLAGAVYKSRVIELDRKQPEHKMTFAEYRKKIVNQRRINQGRDEYNKHAKLLNRVSERYGVAPQYIVALWGIETNYGGNTGGFDILSALATLAYEGRRAEFFEKELTNALKIMASGSHGGGRLEGSWAGAMGQSQFMPSSYLSYAQDGDGDGDRDIWNSLPDVFASIANYLSKSGWDGEMRWGRAVRVPNNIPESLYDRNNMRPLSEWRRMGVTLPSGGNLPYTNDGSDPQAALVAPDGKGTSTYLVYGNYNVIMRWNRSTYFATSVGMLADAIAAAPR